MSVRRKVYLVLMVLLTGLYFVGYFGERYVDDYLGSVQTYKAAPRVEAAEIDRLDVKIQELKDEVLDTLAKCESGGNADVAIVFDSNEKPSIGSFQWQPSSFRYYHEKRTGQKISEREAVVMALDDAKARELAAWVIFETPAGVGKDWINCTKWHGLQSKVDVIKSLTQ